MMATENKAAIDYYEYIEAGIQVIPVQYDIETKQVEYYPNWKQDTANGTKPVTKELMQKWLAKEGKPAPKTNKVVVFNGMAVLLTGNLYAFDFDAKNSPNKISKYGEWVDGVSSIDSDMVQNCPSEMTRTDGHHLYFRHNGDLPCGKLAMSDDGEMISLRGGGLLSFCYPTPDYREINSGLLEGIPLLTREQADAMMQVAAMLNLKKLKIEDKDAPHEPTEYPKRISAMCRKFDYCSNDSTIPDLVISVGGKQVSTGKMNHQYKGEIVKSEYVTYLRPGKDGVRDNDKQYSAKYFVSSKRLVNFSGSWDIFPSPEDEAVDFSGSAKKEVKQKLYVMTPVMVVYHTSGKSWDSAVESMRRIAQQQGFELDEDDEQYPLGKWWSYIKKDSRGKIIEIPVYNVVDFEKWLVEYGFAWYGKQLVLATNGIIKEVDLVFVRKAAKDYIKPLEEAEGEMMNFLTKEINKDITPSFSALRKIQDENILRDTYDYCYIAFTNGVVVIDKAGNMRLVYASELKRYIWEETILQHEITIQTTLPKLESIPFADFCNKISCGIADNFKTITTTIGYLIHEYKKQEEPVAIIFAEDTKEVKDGGGRGKGVTVKAVGCIRKTITINGKTFDPSASFAFQRVTGDVRVVCIDDIQKKSQFEMYNSTISEGLTVNRKGKEERWIPYQYSPKIVFTTNYTIDNEAVFEKRRQRIFLYGDYFSATRTPAIEYGHVFFVDWNKSQWNDFYNFMFYCVKMYMQHGILEMDVTENYKEKAITNKYSEEFLDWIKDNHDFFMAGYRPFNEQYKGFLEFSSFDKNKYSSKQLSNAIKSYAEFHGLVVEKDRSSQVGRELMFRLVDKKAPVDLNADLKDEANNNSEGVDNGIGTGKDENEGELPF